MYVEALGAALRVWKKKDLCVLRTVIFIDPISVLYCMY